jgi:hypothetical protein
MDFTRRSARAVLLTGFALLGAPGAGLAQQQVFLTEPQALQAALGDAERTRPVILKLGPEEQTRLERAAGARLFPGWTRCFQGLAHGRVIAYVCIDNMIGKERPITYLIRIDHPSGQIAMVEIMEYREAIGAEVSAPKFLGQFRHKTVEDPIRLHQDIRNLTGATLSSRALADGARKILHLYEAYLRNLPPSQAGAPQGGAPAEGRAGSRPG